MMINVFVAYNSRRRALLFFMLQFITLFNVISLLCYVFLNLKNRRHHDQQHAGTAIGYVMLFWQARAQICSGTSYKYMNVGSRLHIYEGPIL